jgi:hypothetical protein
LPGSGAAGKGKMTMDCNPMIMYCISIMMYRMRIPVCPDGKIEKIFQL